KVGDITLQEGGQGQVSGNAVPGRTRSKNEGQRRLNLALAQHAREPVEEPIGPYPAQHCETGGRRLRRFQRELRRSAKGGRQLRKLHELGAILLHRPAPTLDEEDRFISS